MYMAYSNNPQLPHVRMEAVRLVRAGWSTVKVARHFGYSQSAIVKWVRRAPEDGRKIIPTLSSRPHHHPQELASDSVERILKLRSERHQCAEILQHRLSQEGITVSLSSVKRTLKRWSTSRYSPWKTWHQYPPRPLPEKPGILIEIDTIHDGTHDERLYVYTLIDVCSRIAYAIPSLHINTHYSLKFVEHAQTLLPFQFQTIQSDHGSEFSKWFTKRIVERGLSHRHSRIRTPNDNAHLERFNRTIQEECLNRITRSMKSWHREIPEYLQYYNTERPHMGLDMKTPVDILETIPSY